MAWAIHLVYTPPYGREFLRGFGKAVSEGLCASASFDLYGKNFLIKKKKKAKISKIKLN